MTNDDISQVEIDHVQDLLALPALWVEPDPGLETQIHDSWRDHVGGPVVVVPAGRRWRARLGMALVGAAAASLLFLGIGLTRQPPAPNLRLDLTATALQPHARGRAQLRETNSGWQIKLNTEGLPRLPDGRFYEAWLEGPKGIVSIGTFHTGVNVTLWAGVEADEYARLTVTIEQEDGNPSSSLRHVLTAPIPS